jgi:hypothetical protein
VKYNTLMAECDFLGLDELKERIQQKKFMERIKTGYKMQIHPGHLNPLTREVANHTWLHVAPIPALPDPTDKQVREAREPITVTQMRPAPQDPGLSEDVEVVSCFEAKIPSRGAYKCPQ